MNPEQLRWYINHFGLIFAPWLAGALGVFLVSLTPIGRAIVDRLRAGGRAQRLAMQSEVSALAAQVEQLNERLDFAERAVTARPAGDLQRVVTPLP